MKPAPARRLICIGDRSPFRALTKRYDSILFKQLSTVEAADLHWWRAPANIVLYACTRTVAEGIGYTRYCGADVSGLRPRSRGGSLPCGRDRNFSFPQSA